MVKDGSGLGVNKLQVALQEKIAIMITFPMIGDPQAASSCGTILVNIFFVSHIFFVFMQLHMEHNMGGGITNSLMFIAYWSWLSNNYHFAIQYAMI